MFAKCAIRAVSAGAIFALLFTTGAEADAIDGDWCFATQNLNIQGPRIRTPGGTEMNGDYTRHTFNYTVPSSEPGAGTPIAMQLMGEDVMSMSRGIATASPEIWRRCKPIS